MIYMLDGLADILTAWFQSIFCWIVTQVLDIGFAFMKLFSAMLPSWEVPSWLVSFTWDPATVNLLALFFPFFTFFFVLEVVISVELILWVVLPLWRLLVDLL
ncbi:MAG: hypothetical protein D3906_02490 [Candidatus Electrothrix sp. AUS1_2]|nr:hypothetical protein [Candidatus Electrothrix sp. AUS1_2]